jgi:hypothetical protein
MKIQITETVRNLNGQPVERVRTNLILRVAYLMIFISIVFIWAGLSYDKSILFNAGLFALLTVTPFLLLYPLIRFFIGGKDSLLGIALTVAIEVGLKNKINKAIEKHERR